MTAGRQRVVFSGPFRARLALVLTDPNHRELWDAHHREAVAADFLVSWESLAEESNGVRALVVTAAPPFHTPGVVVYLARALEDGETVEVRAVGHHLL